MAPKPTKTIAKIPIQALRHQFQYFDHGYCYFKGPIHTNRRYNGGGHYTDTNTCPLCSSGSCDLSFINLWAGERYSSFYLKA